MKERIYEEKNQPRNPTNDAQTKKHNGGERKGKNKERGGNDTEH